MNFQSAQAHKKQLQELHDSASNKLNELIKDARSSNGLVSDEMKASEEYKLAKSHYALTFKHLREFNSFYVKHFKKEIQNGRKV